VNRFEPILACLVLLLPTSASAEKIALRPGLWELSYHSGLTLEQARRLTPKLAEDLLASVPAAQRAEFKRLVESGELLRNTLNTTDTLCLTEEDLERGITPDTEVADACNVRAVTNHHTSQQVFFLCDGPDEEDKGEGTVRITVDSPTTFTGRMTRTLSVATRPFSITVDIKGKWLDSQCGEEALEEEESRLR
jgi:hypothetical protein